jgi:hypothetical protein
MLPLTRYQRRLLHAATAHTGLPATPPPTPSFLLQRIKKKNSLKMKRRKKKPSMAKLKPRWKPLRN